MQYDECFALCGECVFLQESTLIQLKQIINGVVTNEFELQEGDFSIGRSRGNHLQLDDSVVSGNHALISLHPNDYLPEVMDITIRDLGSTNGTFVNGRSVSEQRLKHNDLIKVGTHEFKLFDDKANVSTQTEYYVPED
jgi:pSer/pThr/pTyr-binding forkhead associated (FHA) protein